MTGTMSGVQLPIDTYCQVRVESGSGKSTAVQLIERFYDPAHGTVKLDGNDLKVVWGGV